MAVDANPVRFNISVEGTCGSSDEPDPTEPLINKDRAIREKFLNRNTSQKRESLSNEIALELSRVLATELCGLGEGVNYFTLRTFPELKTSYFSSAQKFFDEDEADPITVSVVSVGERVEYLPASLVEKFAQIDIRVFIKDEGFGTVELIDPNDTADEDIDLITTASETSLKVINGVIGDILDVVESYANRINLNTVKHCYGNRNGSAEFWEQEYVPIEYWVKENSNPISIVRASYAPRDVTHTLIELTNENDTLVRSKMPQIVNPTTKQKALEFLEREGYEPHSYLGSLSKRTIQRSTQDMLVQEISTDEGVLGPSLAAGEISLEVRYM